MRVAPGTEPRDRPAVDCDDVALVLAGGEARTLSPEEERSYSDHVADCEVCRSLATDVREEHLRWIARVPEDALDDPDLLILPTIDPIVFTGERELARGGMGRITKARDRRLGRDVAIKEVVDHDMRARFEREVAITAQLQHPAIVPVYEAGTWPDGSAFYTMRLVSGGTLADAITKTSTLEERLALLRHVLALTDALAYAHSRGIIHRDLKPGNVLVGEFGETVVIDWGLAKELRKAIDDAPEADRISARDLTMVGSVFGTPGFMAPEQAAGGIVDERADVYALGAILYNMLAGVAPYTDGSEPLSPSKLVDLVRERPPTPLVELARDAPEDLLAIVAKAMARDPEARFRTAKEMAEELRRFEAGQLVRSRDYRLRDLFARWVRRHRAAVLVGALALLTVAGVGTSAIANVTRSRAAERDARLAAEHETKIAEANVTSLLEEQGRAQLVSGDRDKALAYLAEAYRRGDNSTALHHMLAAATRDAELGDGIVEPKGGAIAAAAFDADGHLITVDDRDTAKIAIWDRGHVVASHPLGIDVFTVVLSSDVNRAAVITRHSEIAMFDVATGKQLWLVAAPSYELSKLIFDPTGKRLAILPGEVEKTHTTELRDVETGTLLPSPKGRTYAGAFADDGGRLALCGNDGKLVLWNVTAGKQEHLPGQPSDCGQGLAFLGTTKLVVQQGFQQAVLWDLANGKAVPLGHTGALERVATTTRGDLIATSDDVGTVYLWNAEGEQLGRAFDLQAQVQRLAFSPDGRRLAGAGYDQRAAIWDTAALELLAAVHSGHADNYVIALAWSPDGSRLATARINESSVGVFRAPLGHRIARAAVEAAAIADDVAVLADRKHVEVRRLSTGELAATFPLADNAARDAIAVTRDGKRALVTSWAEHHSLAIDLASGAIATLALPHDEDHIGFAHQSADARLVLEVTADQWRVIERSTGNVVRGEAQHEGLDGEISPQGDRIVLIGAGGARLVNLATGESILAEAYDREKKSAEPVPALPVYSRFDPAGRRVVVCSEGVAPVIDAATGKTIARLNHGAGTIEDAQFTDDGRWLATRSSDHIAALWNPETGEQLLRVEGASAVAITPDGERLATGSGDGAIRIWEAKNGGRLLEVMHGDGAGLVALHWSADGTRLLAYSNSPDSASIWDVHLDQRSPAQIADLALRASGWKVDGAVLVRAR